MDNKRLPNVSICKPRTSNPMTSEELANWANAVHALSGAKGSPFTADMFPHDRLKGHHCNCGVTEEGFTKGEFELLPLSDPDVREGGKAYMQCKKCGGWSHL